MEWPGKKARHPRQIPTPKKSPTRDKTAGGGYFLRSSDSRSLTFQFLEGRGLEMHPAPPSPGFSLSRSLARRMRIRPAPPSPGVFRPHVPRQADLASPQPRSRFALRFFHTYVGINIHRKQDCQIPAFYMKCPGKRNAAARAKSRFPKNLPPEAKLSRSRLCGQHKKAPGAGILSFRRSGATVAAPPVLL